MRYEWEDDKADVNIFKHGVDFGTASSVFDDEYARIYFDEAHSDDEIREIIVGYDDRDRLLFVSYTERGDRIHIISARGATPLERKKHERHIKNG